MLNRNTDTRWAKTLINALKNDVEDVPDGWLTSDGVGKEMGVARTQALKMLKTLREKDLVETRFYRVCVNKEYGVVRKVAFYRLKDQKAMEIPKKSKPKFCKKK